VAQTDVKGDRGKRPSEQHNPDVYVRVVDRRKDGIVVRGAKAHTTASPFADELIVLPTRAMAEADADYAVAFAVPVATPGVKLIAGVSSLPGGNRFDYPVTTDLKMVDTVTVFDDVFVPWEKVFSAGSGSTRAPWPMPSSNSTGSRRLRTSSRCASFSSAPPN